MIESTCGIDREEYTVQEVEKMISILLRSAEALGRRIDKGDAPALIVIGMSDDGQLRSYSNIRSTSMVVASLSRVLNGWCDRLLEQETGQRINEETVH